MLGLRPLMIAVIGVTLLAPPPAHAQGAWEQVDNHSQCVVWNPDPSPGIKVTWSGKCADGKTQGLGALHWMRQGNPAFGRFRAYLGHMKDGRYHGDGAFLLGRGTKYDGNWVAGKRQSFGVYRWSDGTRYEGHWRDNKQHGKGVLEEPDKYRYEGQWKNGMPDGHGSDEVTGGGRYTGGWKEGRRHGRGILTIPGQGDCTAQWRDGEMVPGSGRGDACLR